jgi:hypothetical protein
MVHRNPKINKELSPVLPLLKSLAMRNLAPRPSQAPEDYHPFKPPSLRSVSLRYHDQADLSTQDNGQDREQDGIKFSK